MCSALLCPNSLILHFSRSLSSSRGWEVEKSDISSCSERGDKPLCSAAGASVCLQVLRPAWARKAAGAPGQRYGVRSACWVRPACELRSLLWGVHLLWSFLRPTCGEWARLPDWLHIRATKIRGFSRFVLGRDLLSLRLCLPQFYHAWVYLTRDSVLVILGLVLLPKTQIIKSKLNFMLWFF